MKKVFISFHFSEDFNSPDRLLANRVEGLIKSHGLFGTTGTILGGGPLTDRVKSIIEESDALVALMTRREIINTDKWTTHPWVRDEYGHAKSKNINAIAMIEKGVKPEGMYQHNENIPYDPEDPLNAFLQLSATLSSWREESGRSVKLLIQPNKIALDYGVNSEWRYRFNTNGDYSSWQEASLCPEPGGCFLYLPKVSNDALIQIQARKNGKCAESVCSPQWVMVNLEEAGHE